MHVILQEAADLVASSFKHLSYYSCCDTILRAYDIEHILLFLR